MWRHFVPAVGLRAALRLPGAARSCIDRDGSRMNASPEPGAAEAAITSRRRGIRASALNLAARVVGGAGAFALAILTTRVLDTHGRGAYVILTTAAGIAVGVLGAPMPVMLADLMHRRRTEAELRGGLIAIGTLAGVALAVVATGGKIAGFGLPGPVSVQIMTALATGVVIFVSCEMSLAQATGRVTAVGLG